MGSKMLLPLPMFCQDTFSFFSSSGFGQTCQGLLLEIRKGGGVWFSKNELYGLLLLKVERCLGVQLYLSLLVLYYRETPFACDEKTSEMRMK
jgi:hypothetical protein